MGILLNTACFVFERLAENIGKTKNGNYLYQ